MMVQSSHQNLAPDRCLAQMRIETPAVARTVKAIVKPKIRGCRFGVGPSSWFILTTLTR